MRRIKSSNPLIFGSQKYKKIEGWNSTSVDYSIAEKKDLEQSKRKSSLFIIFASQFDLKDTRDDNQTESTLSFIEVIYGCCNCYRVTVDGLTWKRQELFSAQCIIRSKGNRSW